MLKIEVRASPQQEPYLVIVAPGNSEPLFWGELYAEDRNYEDALRVLRDAGLQFELVDTRN